MINEPPIFLKCFPDEDGKVIELPLQCHGPYFFIVCLLSCCSDLRGCWICWFMNMTPRDFILILQELYEMYNYNEKAILKMKNPACYMAGFTSSNFLGLGCSRNHA